jgi:glutathione S-transferase
MQLYQSVGPNPRVATMFIAEKGINIPRQFLDIVAGENRQAPYLAKNPNGGTPLLELDGGAYISDSIAISEYLDETQSGPKLVGSNAAERAQTRMTLRFIDQQIIVPLTTGFRSAEGLPMFESRMLCVPGAAGDMKAMARDGLAKINAQLSGRDFIVGDRFTLADILLFCFVDFGGQVGQSVPDNLTNLHSWQTRIAARPSAAISADPKNGL